MLARSGGQAVGSISQAGSSSAWRCLQRLGHFHFGVPYTDADGGEGDGARRFLGR